MKTIEDFIDYLGEKVKDPSGKDVYFGAFMTSDCGTSVLAAESFFAVKWDSVSRKAEFFVTERRWAGNTPDSVVDFKSEIDPYAPEDEEGEEHPLESVFADVLDQVTKGKGSERHGETEGGRGLTFSDQPIMTITRYVGNGYPLGQAMKKLSEVPALMKHKGRDAAYKEILGAIAYAAAAALYLKED